MNLGTDSIFRFEKWLSVPEFSVWLSLPKMERKLLIPRAGQNPFSSCVVSRRGS
jgi:hypothetical protein